MNKYVDCDGYFTDLIHQGTSGVDKKRLELLWRGRDLSCAWIAASLLRESGVFLPAW